MLGIEMWIVWKKGAYFRIEGTRSIRAEFHRIIASVLRNGEALVLSGRSVVDPTPPGLLSLMSPNTDMNIVRKTETRRVRTVERTSTFMPYFCGTCHERRSVIAGGVFQVEYWGWVEGYPGTTMTK
jgi:hypothetical protein